MACYQQPRAKNPRAKNTDCGKSVSTGSGNQSLSGLMSQWEKENRPGFHEFLNGYRTSSFSDAVKAASRGEYPPNGEKAGKRHSHQWRIPNAAIKQWSKQLNKAQAQIRAFRGQAFEKLFDFFDREARTISGIGPLMVYDTALRIGANIGCLPKDFVYLHADARIPGVQHSVRRIRKSDLPEYLKALRTLNTYEIEVILCVYHDQIEKLMPRP